MAESDSVALCRQSDTICKVNPSLWNSRLSTISSWRVSNIR